RDFKLGRVPKINTWQDNWTDFFIKQRLNPLMDMAIKNREISKEDLNHFDNLKEAFKKDMDSHHSDASLLHGDLWSGNFSFLEDGKPILIDPDVYYG
ncbi:fructosamine kinase family protein, partial [Enterococcus lactis]